MGRKKRSKPTLNVIPSPEPARLLSPEAEDELQELIRSINAKSKQKAEAEDKPHTEHDPNLPPAA